MIDKTKLLILGLVAVALISMGAFFAWYITSKSYETDLANQTTEYNKQLKAISDKAASDMALEIEKHNKTQKELNDLNVKSNQEKAKHEKENTQLKLDIANGTRKLQFANAGLATCKLSKDTGAAASSLGNGAEIELSPTVQQDLLDIRNGIQSDQDKLDYLQEYIRVRGWTTK
ncbi:hypothetical protein H0088_004065 [Salmonella enterica]|nr:hypothetical protein [Salmonella enterica]